MFLCDVNVYVHAHREDSSEHVPCRQWLEGVINGEASYGFSDLALSGFLRVVTHPKVFARPSPMSDALAFAQQVRDQPNAVRVAPGARHWEVFRRLCEAHGVRGNLVPDAWFAALAIESGSEWVTMDRDYARFAGLKLQHLTN